MQTPSRLPRPMRMAQSLGVLLIVGGTVAGCATALPRPEPITATRVAPAACPQVTQYGQDFMNRVADAEEGLQNDSPLVVVVDDWIKMRDQARACRRPK